MSCAVVRVPGAAEAVRQINEARYGLGASIWSQDVARAERLGERLEVGVVNVNNHAFSGAIPALPWSGTWDDLPAAHAAAIAFDLLTLAGLWLLGRRLRGPRLYSRLPRRQC